MRKFRPTYVVTVTPREQITAGETVNGQPFTTIREATVSREGKEDLVRTIVAFGPASSEIASRLAPGRPVRLAVQNDGGMLRAIGLPREDAA